MSSEKDIQDNMFTPESGQRVVFQKNGVHIGCKIFSSDGSKNMQMGFYPHGGYKITATIKELLNSLVQCSETENGELWIPDPILQQEGTIDIDVGTELNETNAEILGNILCGEKRECEFMESISGNNPNRIVCKTKYKYSLLGTNCRSFLASLFGPKESNVILTKLEQHFSSVEIPVKSKRNYKELKL